MVAQKNKKIQLKKRSRQSARIHRGLAMPVGPGSENSLVSFRDTVWAHLSLGTRRFHDLNKPGALFAIPYIAYLASYILPVLAFDTAALAAQSIMAVCYLGLATVKGTDGDNAYGPERAR